MVETLMEKPVFLNNLRAHYVTLCFGFYDLSHYIPNVTFIPHNHDNLFSLMDYIII